MAYQDFKERNVTYEPEIGDLIIEHYSVLESTYGFESRPPVPVIKRVGMVIRTTAEDFRVDWVGQTPRQTQVWFRYEDVQEAFKKKSWILKKVKKG